MTIAEIERLYERKARHVDAALAILERALTESDQESDLLLLLAVVKLDEWRARTRRAELP